MVTATAIAHVVTKKRLHKRQIHCWEIRCNDVKIYTEADPLYMNILTV